MDSNQRYLTVADLQSDAIATMRHPQFFIGADGGIRTPDPLITNQLLWPTELHRHILFGAIIERTILYSPVFGFANV